MVIKKHFFIFFIIVVAMGQYISAFSIKEKISNFLTMSHIGWASMSSLFCTDYQFKTLGSKNISPALDNSIRAILAELDLEHRNIHIKQMSDHLANLISRSNALATANAIFVDEEFMNSLSINQLRAIIGHEGIHIKDKHTLCRLIASCLGLVGYLGIELMLPEAKSAKGLALYAGCTAGNISTFTLAGLAYARYLEQSADLKSMQILQCQCGAADLWKSVKISQENSSVIGKLKSWIGDKFSTHPSCIERKAYLSARR